MKALIFDTETIGLPVAYDAPITDTYNWPRVYQLSWMLVDEGDLKVYARHNHFIEPDGWEIPDTEFHRATAPSMDFLRDNGWTIKSSLEMFVRDASEADVLVAHNVGFDRSVLCCELYRAGMRFLKKPEFFCTKEESTEIVKLPSGHPNSKYKWPTLSEAHKFFYGKGHEGAHDAMQDVKACAGVYFAIKNYKKFLV